MSIILKSATENDCGLIFNFINSIASYVKMSDEVKNSPSEIKKYFFDKKVAFAQIAYYNNTPAGFALYYFTYSSFVGKQGLYLEDLFVNKEYRGKGVGKALLKKMAQLALENDCSRFEWVCLDWNKPSIDFYLSMGAEVLDDCRTYRLSGDSLIKASR